MQNPRANSSWTGQTQPFKKKALLKQEIILSYKFAPDTFNKPFFFFLILSFGDPEHQCCLKNPKLSQAYFTTTLYRSPRTLVRKRSKTKTSPFHLLSVGEL